MADISSNFFGLIHLYYRVLHFIHVGYKHYCFKEHIGLRNRFVAFLYFLLFYNDFLLLGKMYIFIQ